MSNPVRTCIGCAQTDDHPRHVIELGTGDIVTFHMDCHVIAAGCEICEAQIEGADGVKGQELREHLQTTDSSSASAPGWTRPTDAQFRKELT